MVYRGTSLIRNCTLPYYHPRPLGTSLLQGPGGGGLIGEVPLYTGDRGALDAVAYPLVVSLSLSLSLSVSLGRCVCLSAWLSLSLSLLLAR